MNRIQSYFDESTSARRMLLWLSFECPGRGNPAGCPLHSIRHLPPEDRRRLIQRMDDSELIRLYRAHSACSLSIEGVLASEGASGIGNS